MTTETEAKFLAVNHDDVRAALTAAGAKLETPMRQMKRAILDYPDGRMQKESNAFIRVRDEVSKITVTYKQFESLEIGGAKELELKVDSFETAIELFETLGLTVLSLQESRRETWQLGDVEVVLDEWPWLKPYIEIEGPSEQSVTKAASSLGFSWDKAVFGDVMAAYRADYPHLSLTDGVGNLTSVKFDDPLPDMFKK